MHRLDGKTILITGAARGIGAACARACAGEGARVILTDIRDELGAAVASEIGPAASYERLDVRREADWDRVVAAVLGAGGRLDGLVNNAGITGFDDDPGPQDVERATLETWRAVHATNLDGVFLGCRAAIGAMKPPAGGGSIVNISSRSGVVGQSGAAAYASSKAAVRNHTRSVALYAAERGLGIRCNAVLPGAVLTPMWDAMLGDEPGREAAINEVARTVPLGRMGSVSEIASLVVHLLSDESSYTTGGEFAVDGGITAGEHRPADS